MRGMRVIEIMELVVQRIDTRDEHGNTVADLRGFASHYLARAIEARNAGDADTAAWILDDAREAMIAALAIRSRVRADVAELRAQLSEVLAEVASASRPVSAEK